MELICVCGKGIDVIGDRASQPIFDFLTDLGVAHVSPVPFSLTSLLTVGMLVFSLILTASSPTTVKMGGSGSFNACDGRGVSHKEPVAV